MRAWKRGFSFHNNCFVFYLLAVSYITGLCSVFSIFCILFSPVVLFLQIVNYQGKRQSLEFCRFCEHHLSLVTSSCANDREYMEQLWQEKSTDVSKWKSRRFQEKKLLPIRFCSCDYILKIFCCLLNSAIPSVNKEHSFHFSF